MKITLTLSLRLLSFLAMSLFASPTVRAFFIETGMHIAPIGESAIDAAGSLLLTGGDDTARLWSLKAGEEGRLLRVFHGDGVRGCALSADGRRAAIAHGRRVVVAHEVVAHEVVDIFDTSNGALLKSCKIEAEYARTVRFSPGGSVLAASLGTDPHAGGKAWRNGICVLDGASGEVIAEEATGGKAPESIEWFGEERLVVAGGDGGVRLYQFTREGKNGALKLVARMQGSGKGRPQTARFSPDGSRIAVGYAGSQTVTLHEAKDLALLHTLSTTTEVMGDLSRVAWLATGDLAASGELAGHAAKGARAIIHVWPAASLVAKDGAVPRQMPASARSITDLDGLPGGSLVYVAATPEWGVMDAGGAARTLGACPIARFDRLTSQPDRFRISSDATEVAFDISETGSPTIFATSTLKLTRLASFAELPKTFHPPRVKSAKLNVTDWQNSRAPKLGGKALELPENELSRALAISVDDRFIYLGTDSSIRAYNDRGTTLWSWSVDRTAWAVNVSDDRQLAVAAHDDGSIRWKDAMTGKGFGHRAVRPRRWRTVDSVDVGRIFRLLRWRGEPDPMGQGWRGRLFGSALEYLLPTRHRAGSASEARIRVEGRQEAGRNHRSGNSAH